MNGETEAWRGREKVTHLEEPGCELMFSDVNAFPLTTLPLVCSCTPVPSVVSCGAPKMNRTSHLDHPPLLTHCPWASTFTLWLQP